jgi:hypothetical protein
MNDPKTLQEIAEKAADYTRTHTSEVPQHELKAAVLIALNQNVRFHYGDASHAPLNIALAHAIGYRDAQGEFVSALPTLTDTNASLNRARELLGAKSNEGIPAAIERMKREHEERTNAATEHLKILRTHIDVGVRPFVNAEKLRADLTKLVEETIARLTEQPEQANIGIVQKPPPPPPPPAAPPKPEEISDELAQATADYANANAEGFGGGLTVKNAVEYGLKSVWGKAARAFVEGARWQRNVDAVELAAMKQALAEGADSIGKLLAEVERLEKQSDADKSTIAATAEQAAEWRDQLERSEADAIDKQLLRKQPDPSDDPLIMKALLSNPAFAPTPIVFRSDDERDFWDEQVHALNRRGDRSTMDVANAADEMVEERRRRMAKAETVNDERDATIVQDMRRISELETFIERVRLRLVKMLGKEESFGLGDALDLVEAERSQAKEEPLIVSETPMRTAIVALPETNSHEPEEAGDELLLEAARYANEFCEEQPSDDDLNSARAAVKLKHFGRWSSTVRTYVDGVLRKARKT